MKITLITNLSYVTIHGSVKVRTNTDALIIESGKMGISSLASDALCEVRGFGPDSAWPVFDIRPASAEFTLANAQGNAFLYGDGEPIPLCSGAIMQFKDGPRLDLMVSDYKRPLDIQTFEGEHSITYEKMWVVLNDRVVRYCHTPAMPHLIWGPPSMRAQINAAQGRR